MKRIEKGKAILTTIAGVTSLVIMDLLNRAKVKIQVIFVDAGFLFKKISKGLTKVYPVIGWTEEK